MPRYYEPTPFNPAAFEQMVGPSTGQAILEGAVSGVVAPLAAQAKIGQMRQDNDRMKELARLLKNSLVQQGFSEDEARAGALIYVREGPDALETAVMQPKKAAADVRIKLGQAQAQDITNRVNEQTALPRAQADIASTEAGTQATLAGVDQGNRSLDIESRKVDLQKFRDEFAANLGERKQSMAEQAQLSSYDVNQDFELDAQEQSKLFRNHLQQVRSDYEREVDKWSKMKPVDQMRAQKPPEMTEDDFRKRATELMQRDVQRFKEDAAYYKQTMGGGAGGGAGGGNPLPATPTPFLTGGGAGGGAGGGNPLPATPTPFLTGGADVSRRIQANTYEQAVQLINQKITDPTGRQQALEAARQTFGVR